MALHLSPLRILALSAAALALSGCAVWSGGDAPAPRTSVSLSAPSTVERPEWLQKLVVQMDEQAFPAGGTLTLKMSYELSPDIVRQSLAMRAAASSGS